MNYVTYAGMNGRPVNIDAGLIVAEVAFRYGITPIEIKKESRKARIVEPRQVAMYLLRRYTLMSFDIIGEIFEKDHSTVIYSCRQVENLMQMDKNLRTKVEGLSLFILQKKLPTNGTGIKEFSRMPNWEKKRELQ